MSDCLQVFWRASRRRAGVLSRAASPPNDLAPSDARDSDRPHCRAALVCGQAGSGDPPASLPARKCSKGSRSLSQCLAGGKPGRTVCRGVVPRVGGHTVGLSCVPPHAQCAGPLLFRSSKLPSVRQTVNGVLTVEWPFGGGAAARVRRRSRRSCPAAEPPLVSAGEAGARARRRSRRFRRRSRRSCPAAEPPLVSGGGAAASVRRRSRRSCPAAEPPLVPADEAGACGGGAGASGLKAV